MKNSTFIVIIFTAVKYFGCNILLICFICYFLLRWSNVGPFFPITRNNKRLVVELSTWASRVGPTSLFDNWNESENPCHAYLARGKTNMLMSGGTHLTFSTVDLSPASKRTAQIQSQRPIMILSLTNTCPF